MRTAIYSVVCNNVNAIDNFYAFTKEADLVFIMDTGSTDGTFEKLLEYADKDHRIKLSELQMAEENNALAKLNALNSLTYIVQNSFASWACYFPIDAVAQSADWLSSIKSQLKSVDVSCSNATVLFSMLSVHNNVPYISYTHKAKLFHRTEARCNWSHPTNPYLTVAGETFDLNCNLMLAVKGIETLEEKQAAIDCWNADRSNVISAYYALLALSDTKDVTAVIDLILDVVLKSEVLDNEEGRYCVEILLLLYSITDSESYLNLVQYYFPEHYSVPYYKAQRNVESPYIALGYYLEALEKYPSSNNLVIYGIPNFESKLRHHLAVTLQTLFNVTGQMYYLDMCLLELQTVIQLDPASVSAKHDYDTMLKLKETTLNEVEES